MTTTLLLAGCSLLPVSIQSRNVAALMDVPGEEIVTVVRRASATHRLPAQWVRQSAENEVEIGMGEGATSLSVVFRHLNGRWSEVQGSKQQWSPSSDFSPPPAQASY